MRETQPYSGPDGAERLAVDALGFIASDRDELERFLAQSGIDPRRIREAAKDPGFLVGVLDHIVGDEARLIAFAGHLGVAPAVIGEIRARLAATGTD